MSIECPHCGKDLAEVGVLEVRCILKYPDDHGHISWNDSGMMCDDKEKYLCAHCDGDLRWEELDDDWCTRILACKAEATRYEKHFGTPERAAATLYAIRFSNAELFEESAKRIERDFLGGTIFKGSIDHLYRWSKWLQGRSD